jgi:signal transduction histidine kinase
VPEVSDSVKAGAATESERDRELRRFFHDLATPLSGVSLHLERASRLAARGEDPEEALSTARRELHRAFELFERARAELLKP